MVRFRMEAYRSKPRVKKIGRRGKPCAYPTPTAYPPVREAGLDGEDAAEGEALVAADEAQIVTGDFEVL